MKITQVRIYPVEDPKLKGFASIIFDDCFVVSDIKIIQGKEGFFISMPSKKKRDGQYKDIAHPINREMRELIEKALLEEYEKVTGKSTKPEVPEQTGKSDLPASAESTTLPEEEPAMSEEEPTMSEEEPEISDKSDEKE